MQPFEGFNPEALTLRVHAIERWRDVEARLNAHGMTLGWAPPTRPLETMGELLEARAEGLRSSLYGDAAASCVAVEAVLTDGTPVRSKVVPRSAAGPDWKHLLLGGRGRTGRIVTAVMRVHPRPQVIIPVAYEIAGAAEAVEALGTLFHRGATPAIAALVPASGGFRLLLTFEGHPGLSQARADIASRTCLEHHAVRLGEAPVLEWLAAVEGGDGHRISSRLLLSPALRLEGAWADLPGMVKEVASASHLRFCVTHVRHASAALLVEADGVAASAMEELSQALQAAGGRLPMADTAERPVGSHLVGAHSRSIASEEAGVMKERTAE